MRKFKKHLAKEIEEYLSRIDFDTAKIANTMRDITEDEDFNIRLSSIIDKILDSINNQINLVVEDIVAEIDADSMAEKIVSEMKGKIFTFQQNQFLLEPTCSTCYRMFGEWVTPSGGKLTEPEVNKPGTKILFIEDF